MRLNCRDERRVRRRIRKMENRGTTSTRKPTEARSRMNKEERRKEEYKNAARLYL